jgi:precorrin-4/cobalt-precorrin-4 C11-methyltransferase
MTSYPKETPAAIVYRASWPDQKILRGTLENLPALVKQSGITRQALIIVGEVLNQDFEYSKLYDPAFSHGWRAGRKDPEV